MNERDRAIWEQAIDAVLELMSTHPPSKVGEAVFTRKLIYLKGQCDARTTNKPNESS